MYMKKRILFTILLIIILLSSVFVGYFLSKRISTKKVENTLEIESNIINKNYEDELSEESKSKIEENNVVSEQKNEVNDIETIKEQSKPSNSSASKTATTKNSNTKKNESTNSKVVENNKAIQESKKEEISSSSKTEEVKEENKKLNENTPTEKSIEIVYEVPDKSSLKNDPEYIRLMKNLFETFKECDAKGDEVRISDMDNILTSTCEAVYYKGAEIGWKLRIKYVDGTYKYYKK